MNALAEIAYLEEEVEYPDSDGKPMAESEFQLVILLYTLNALRTYFQSRPDVYVVGNLLLYYEKGNPGAVVSPDVFVVIGAEKHLRRSYMLWQEPKAPDFVLEISSKSTVRDDQGRKRGLYALLEVQEYFQYDPTGDFLEPPLQGLGLQNGRYLPLPLKELSDGTLVIVSDVLGLELHLSSDGEFYFMDPMTGERLISHKEAMADREKALAAQKEAEDRAKAAETHLAELEEQLRRMQDKG